jgi:hypothetical protein
MRKHAQTLLAVLMSLFGSQAIAQEGDIKTIFKGDIRSSGGYGAVTNKFTTIRGDYLNMVGAYGGWFVDHRLMIGIAGAASTNDFRVPREFSTDLLQDRTWQYVQFGLITEYVLFSDKPVHFAFNLFGGPGFTLQYQRNDWDHNQKDNTSDENWFVVLEPGAQLEINLFKWMRLSPGVSYRATFGSDGRGLSDSDMGAVSYNITAKFGRF